MILSIKWARYSMSTKLQTKYRMHAWSQVKCTVTQLIWHPEDVSGYLFYAKKDWLCTNSNYWQDHKKNPNKHRVAHDRQRITAIFLFRFLCKWITYSLWPKCCADASHHSAEETLLLTGSSIKLYLYKWLHVHNWRICLCFLFCSLPEKNFLGSYLPLFLHCVPTHSSGPLGSFKWVLLKTQVPFCQVKIR